MNEASLRSLGVKFGVQVWRELAIGISRRFLQPKHLFQRDEEDDDPDINEDQMENVLDAQAGHSSWVAGAIYARGVIEMQGAIASQRESYFRASQEWHQFLGLDSSSMTNGHKRKASKMMDPTDPAFESRLARVKRLRRMDLEGKLREMLGPEVEFRGIQRPAIEMIIQGLSFIVMVMGTGGGKSLAFMLPAFCNRSGLIVVVVPLVGLRQDMMDRCEKLGIPCIEWHRQIRAEVIPSRLIFVTPESAVTEEFQMFLSRKRAASELDRIFIDECHVILND